MRKARAPQATPDTSIDASGDSTPPVLTPEPPLSALPTAYPVEDDLPASVSPFGEVPRLATHWGINRVGLGGTWDVLAWGDPGDPLESREWPLSDLSVETVRARWGAGTYRVQFLSGSDRGGRKHVSHGRTVTMRAAPPPAAAPAPAPASPFGPEMDRMLQMQRMIGQEASEKMGQVLQFATVLAGAQRPSGGLGAAELQLILQKQAETTAASTKELVTALLAPINAKLDALDADDDDDDDGGAVGKAAAIGAGLIKGKGWLPMVLNWANGNPEVAKEVVKHGLPIVASAATKIAEVISGPRPAPPLPVAVPDLRPHHGNGVIAPTAGPPDIEQGSLRAFASPAAPPSGAPTS